MEKNRGDTEAMAILSFFLKEAIDMSLHTSLEQLLQLFRDSKKQKYGQSV